MPNQSIHHYENFPVASWLCPPQLRPAIVAIYHFARTADDIADEGQAPPTQRLEQLQHYRKTLIKTSAHGPNGVPHQWQWIFQPLHQALITHQLPTNLLLQLLDAFEQDVHNPPYSTRDELLHYCQHSANPIGRLLLHLYGVTDVRSLEQSDAICSALQLINFWQDMHIDVGRNRCYIPLSDLSRVKLTRHQLQPGLDQPAITELMQDLVEWSRQLMLSGAPLALRLPGRIGWELRWVIQGGLRILEKIHHNQYQCLVKRPQIKVWDAPILGWRTLFMNRTYRDTP